MDLYNRNWIISIKRQNMIVKFNRSRVSLGFFPRQYSQYFDFFCSQRIIEGYLDTRIKKFFRRRGWLTLGMTSLILDQTMMNMIAIPIAHLLRCFFFYRYTFDGVPNDCTLLLFEKYEMLYKTINRIFFSFIVFN